MLGEALMLQQDEGRQRFKFWCEFKQVRRGSTRFVKCGKI
jgi:hypothetical protein